MHCVRGDGQDLGVTSPEFLVILAQLRQVPTAEGSGEAPQEDEDHVLPAAVIGQAHQIPTRRRQREIWSFRTNEDLIALSHHTTSPIVPEAFTVSRFIA
jgi:hypothetical protein